PDSSAALPRRLLQVLPASASAELPAYEQWLNQIIAGIGWELVSEAVAEVKGPLPDFSASAS
ncbi:MAG: hypothetical protein QOC42_03085, partial [Nitrososphaeraceae archaeon]|nr:hypothetical protein [Nitrososphaeraceae archaeon]